MIVIPFLFRAFPKIACGRVGFVIISLYIHVDNSTQLTTRYKQHLPPYYCGCMQYANTSICFSNSTLCGFVRGCGKGSPISDVRIYTIIIVCEYKILRFLVQSAESKRKQILR